MADAEQALPADVECPWYERISKPGLIDQGQILTSFLVVEPPAYADLSNPQAENVGQYWDVIILTQSYDFENDKAENVLLCPAAEPKLFTKFKQSSFSDAKKGRVAGCHVLPPCNLKDFAAPARIAYFPKTFSVPVEHVKSYLATQHETIVLKSPYREHLAQAFGFFIMRIAKPVDY